MLTQAQQRRERKQLLAQVRRAQRELDSRLEVFERRIKYYQSRKRLLDPSDAQDLSKLYDTMFQAVRGVEKAMTNFNGIVMQ